MCFVVACNGRVIVKIMSFSPPPDPTPSTASSSAPPCRNTRTCGTSFDIYIHASREMSNQLAASSPAFLHAGHLRLGLLGLPGFFEVLLEELSPRAHGNVARRHSLQAKNLAGEAQGRRRDGRASSQQSISLQHHASLSRRKQREPEPKRQPGTINLPTLPVCLL